MEQNYVTVILCIAADVLTFPCGLAGPRNHALGGVPDSPTRRPFFCHTWSCPGVPAVDILSLLRYVAAAMRPFATSTVASC